MSQLSLRWVFVCRGAGLLKAIDDMLAIVKWIWELHLKFSCELLSIEWYTFPQTAALVYTLTDLLGSWYNICVVRSFISFAPSKKRTQSVWLCRSRSCNHYSKAHAYLRMPTVSQLFNMWAFSSKEISKYHIFYHIFLKPSQLSVQLTWINYQIVTFISNKRTLTEMALWKLWILHCICEQQKNI